MHMLLTAKALYKNKRAASRLNMLCASVPTSIFASSVFRKYMFSHNFSNLTPTFSRVWRRDNYLQCIHEFKCLRVKKFQKL